MIFKDVIKLTLITISCAGLVLSCDSGTKPASNKPASPVKKAVKKKSSIPSTPTTKIDEKVEDDIYGYKSKQFEYSYSPIDKRDPFKPYEGEYTVEVSKDRTPLERYSLDQLQLTAIVWGISNPRGLVRAPDGQDYIIKRDMRIGRNSGRVARITKSEVVVAEEYRDPLGKLIVKETKLALQKDKDFSQLMKELE